MQPAEYTQLRAYEEWYWWYAAQRMNLLSAVRDLKSPRRARVLDVGCGSGATLTALARELSLCGHGVDVSEHAAALWNVRGDVWQCRGSVNELPYSAGAFEAVYSVDVLGCRGVERGAAMGEMARVLRPGGAMVLLAPAYQWMLSAHDAAVHSVHRFTRAELAALARAAGLEVVRITHRFPLFFPAIATVRLVRKLILGAEFQMQHSPAPAGAGYAGTQASTGSASLHPWLHSLAPVGGQTTRLSQSNLRRADDGLEKVGVRGQMTRLVRSDLSPLPRWLNGLLLGAAKIEHAIVRGINVPFGSTILLVARKVGQ